MPETVNGYLDDDGCPDRPRVIVQESIRIIRFVHFAFGSAEPLPESAAVLRDLVDVLKDHPEIEIVGVLGHGASIEPARVALGLRRAERVKILLEQQGVDPARLEAHSLRASLPLDSRPGDVRNRYVRFLLVRARGDQIFRWTGDDYEAVPAPPPPPPPPPPSPLPPPTDPSCPRGPVASVLLCCGRG